jgi:hypothetical protein
MTSISGREQQRGRPRASGRMRHGDGQRERGNLGSVSECLEKRIYGNASLAWIYRSRTVPPAVAGSQAKTCDSLLA